jgi:hypothetical protein
MNFIYPDVLWGLGALVIPIVIHLFSFRTNKKVLFSDIRWLKQIQEKTSQKTKVQNWLLLLVRLLTIALMVIAFAQPVVGPLKTLQTGREAYSIFVDNSPSMQLQNEKGVLFEQARLAAKSIALKAKADDIFQLIHHDANVGEQRVLSKEAFLLAIDALKPTEASRNSAEIIGRQHSWLQDQRANRELIWISDMQRSTLSAESFKSDTTVKATMLNFQAERVSNLFIDTAWLESPVVLPNQKNRLIFRVVNSGDKAKEAIRISFEVSEVEKGMTTLDLPAGSRKMDTLDFTLLESGWQKARIKLDDQPVNFDDHYYLSFEVKNQLSVLIIFQNQPNPYLKAFFENDPTLRATFIESTKIDLGKIDAYSTIILDHLTEINSGLVSTLKQRLELGSGLVVFPSAQLSPNGFSLLTTALELPNFEKLDSDDWKVSKAHFDDELLKETFKSIPSQPDLPIGKSRFRCLSDAAFIPIMEVNGGDVLIGRKTIKNGNLLWFNVPLDNQWSNLPKHALFVPILYRSILLNNKPIPLAFRLGQNETIFLPISVPSEEVFELISGNTRYMPEIRSFQNGISLRIGNMRDAGWYTLTNQNSDTNYVNIALNPPSDESLLGSFDSEQRDLLVKNGYVVTELEDATTASALLNRVQRPNTWKWFLLAVLVFLIIETLLLKLRK